MLLGSPFKIIVTIQVLAHLSHAQQVDPDTVSFKTIAIFNDLRQCLKDVLDPCSNYGGTCPNNNIADCKTNACFCRASTLGQAVINAGALVMSRCSNLDDRSSATSIVTRYCADKGYTEIVTPTILTSGVSRTVTITATPTAARTVTAYATRTIYASAARPAIGRDWLYPFFLAAITAISLFGV